MIKQLKPLLLAVLLAGGLSACTTVEPAEPEPTHVVKRTVVMACEELEEKTCPDCELWKERALQAEEKSHRLQDQLQNCLRK